MALVVVYICDAHHCCCWYCCCWCVCLSCCWFVLFMCSPRSRLLPLPRMLLTKLDKPSKRYVILSTDAQQISNHQRSHEEIFWNMTHLIVILHGDHHYCSWYSNLPVHSLSLCLSVCLFVLFVCFCMYLCLCLFIHLFRMFLPTLSFYTWRVLLMSLVVVSVPMLPRSLSIWVSNSAPEMY
jgi:hypothetical protein